MTHDATVIYNHTCPICRREIDAYRRTAEARDLPLRFKGLDSGALAEWGLSVEDAARRLHVVENGRLLAGVDAFVALWKRLPNMRWLARLVERPVIRPLAHGIYEWILAPILYAMHRRRVRARA